MRALLTALVVSGLTVACASFEASLPRGYTGPTAEISDDFKWEGSTKNQLFYVEAIDGKPLESGLILTRRATAGNGFGVSARTATHTIPAVPLRLKLVATHVTGAPIHALFSQVSGAARVGRNNRRALRRMRRLLALSPSGGLRLRLIRPTK